MAKLDDSALVHQILSGKRRAMQEFYRQYTPGISRFIHGKVSDENDAQEVLSDTLFAFLEALRDYRGTASIKTFLYAIAQHKVIDYYRKKKIKQLLFSRAPQLQNLISPLLSPEEELDATMLKEKIQGVLSQILPKYRSILVLKYIDNVSVTEIAKKCAISFKSAESQLFRARKAFVELFLSI